MPKKKYSINWENDEPVSFEVDGILYESIDQVTDEADREKLTDMLDAALDPEFDKEFKDFDKEFAAHKKNSVNAEKLILGIFSGVAALMLMIAAISAFGAVSKISREASAPGRVVEVVVERAYVNEQDRIVRDFYYPVIEFTAGDGRRRSVQVSEGSDYAYYEAGDEVTVRYDPEHPLDARIQSAGSDALMWVLPGITGLLGLGFLGAVMVVRRFMLPTETE
ncbi:MAG TPA: DUF3592 domain-containing protein [Anaerolineales bacterium]|nr:DUF3592 domain-containing protein [Anaerolineales bacterium]